MSNFEFLEIAITVSFVLLSLAGIATVTRLVRGPTLHDRIVALDVMSAIVVGIVGTVAIEGGESALVDVSLVVALVAFLGTVAFSIFLEAQKRYE
jgi:multicomponent Na+:H+ antiporter subunit F